VIVKALTLPADDFQSRWDRGLLYDGGMRAVLSICLVVSLGCGGSAPPPPPTTIEDGADVTYTMVYQADAYTEFGFSRDWTPVDLAAGPRGELWVVQRMARDTNFDEATECTAASQCGAPNDCVSLQGSTVSLADPGAIEAASAANGRARTVIDVNSWHFMRRPSAIAFGAAEIRIAPSDPGALDPITGAPLLTTEQVYLDTFATCPEHRTANFTDAAPFIGPTLWTADPAIYNGVNGTFAWSNGAHLDMVHASEHCVGLAYEQANVYWLFNGALGTLDRYDFAAPHVPGHEYHLDARVGRYSFGADALARIANVPSNMVVDGTDLFVADTGNGRVVRFDLSAQATMTGTFTTHEAMVAELYDAPPLDTIASTELLAAQWGAGARIEPSGLVVYSPEILVIASHATGHLTLINRDGTHVRTLDTGLGEGIGGLAVVGGQIYFAHTRERRVYRVDVVPPAMP
jgi:hypothetical protein